MPSCCVQGTIQAGFLVNTCKTQGCYGKSTVLFCFAFLVLLFLLSAFTLGCWQEMPGFLEIK